MGLAYCILAHKNPAQLARLLRALAHPGNVCFLHYERRAPRREHEAVARLAREFPNVHLLPPRRIVWGRFSQIRVQLEGLALGLQGAGWSHFITLTGQDFPLRPQAEIVRELAAAPAASFVSFFDPFQEQIWNNVRERIGRIHLQSAALESLLQVPFLGRRLRRLLGWSDCMPHVPFVQRETPSWFRYMGGSNHVTLSREAAVYLAGDPLARRIIQWLQRSGHPDESIFQSVLCNSPLAATLVNDDRRAILWEHAGAPSPATLTQAHLPWLRAQREAGKLFARKFDTAVDSAVLDALEKDLAL